MRALGTMPVIILAGGLGTRLRSVVRDRSKVLAPMGKKTNLDLIMDNLLRVGFRELILAVGYMHETVRAHIKGRTFPKGVRITFSSEREPLGTGGAIKKAFTKAKGDTVLVLNGDTFCDIPFADFVKFHHKKRGTLSIVLVPRKDLVSGGVEIDRDEAVIRFSENSKEPHRYMSAGAYLMNRSVLKNLPKVKRFSIEHDFFPQAAAQGDMYGYRMKKEAFDIGTPERYTRAQQILAK
jgi:D-glycero-alpha-D-manno-heptose 1-phosphate guanylyltransferase